MTTASVILKQRFVSLRFTRFRVTRRITEKQLPRKPGYASALIIW
jgi:hypothetical protein